MKKTMLLAGMVALALTSCSKDEELASIATSDENQIRFSVVSDKHTRASVDRGTVLTSTNLPEFKAFGTLSDGGLDVTPELNWSTFARGGNTLPGTPLGNLGNSNQGSNIFTFAGEGKLPRWTSGKAMDFFAFYSADQETGDMWNGTVLNYSSVGEFFKFVQDSEGNAVKTWEHPYAQVKTKEGDEYLHDGWDDLIYAVSRNVEPANNVISLNFRHALSQICFKAQNLTAEDLDIEVAGFKLDRVHTSATMTWAKGNTTVNFITDLDDIFQEGGNNPDDFCHWDIDYSQPATGSYLNYHSFGNVKPGTTGDENRLTIKLTDEVQDLTGYEWESEGAAMKPWFVIPQKFIPWKEQFSDKTGTRLMVLVKIKPINHPEKYGDYVVQNIDGEEIYSKYKGTTDKNGNAIFAWAAVAPVSRTHGVTEDGEHFFEWQQNRKYVYTLIFDGFNSGLVPDPSDDPDKEPDPNDPDPDKEPVVDVNRQADEFIFQITVDEYDADSDDVWMPGKPQGVTSILG